MAIGKLNPINKDDLKVGDVVGIAREVRCGWGMSFRHVMVYPAEIVRSELHTVAILNMRGYVN